MVHTYPIESYDAAVTILMYTSEDHSGRKEHILGFAKNYI